MKRIFTIICLIACLFAKAQNNVVCEYMYIYNKDKSVERINILNVDSITFISPEIAHEAVDLGLSVKWATCNVGAFSSWESGGYYAWGETEEKTQYDWSTYKYCDGTQFYMTKYCTNSSYGSVDNKTVLDVEDDVAHVKWGGSWRVPTTSEIYELINNCSWNWTVNNGVNGYTVTGSTGNSIFLPVTGYRYGTAYHNNETLGYFWSNGLISGPEARSAYHTVYLSQAYTYQATLARSYGLTIRPVCEY